MDAGLTSGRSRYADDLVRRIAAKKTPYEVTLAGLTIQVDENVYPTGPLSVLMAKAIKDPVFGVKANESVLDYGTGTGYLALVSAQAGGKVVAVDINGAAVACAQKNITQNSLNERIQVRGSDCFSAIRANERFDVITAGIPWEPGTPINVLEMAVYDSGFRMRRELFNSAKEFLTPNGRIFFSYSERVQKIYPIAQFISGYESKIVADELIKDERHFIFMFTHKN